MMLASSSTNASPQGIESGLLRAKSKGMYTNSNKAKKGPKGCQVFAALPVPHVKTPKSQLKLSHPMLQTTSAAADVSTAIL